MPIMRPLFLEFPQEEWLYGNQEEFLLGPDMLVAPRVWEMAMSYDVQLPAGEWYDYWSGQKVTGGQVRPKRAPAAPPAPNELPVFVRAGAIIPHQPVIQSTQEVPQGPLELRVYPGPNCEGSLYMDDGHTFNYQHGEFMRESFTCSRAEHSVIVQTNRPEGSYKPWFSQVQFTVYGITSAPGRVNVDGVAVQDFRFDPARGVVTVVGPQTASSLEISY